MERKLDESNRSLVLLAPMGFLALSVVALIRFVATWIFKEDLNQDIDAYRALAESLSTTGVLGLDVDHPTAFRPPLYPWILHWFVTDGAINLYAVVGLHLLLALATCALAMKIFCRIYGDVPWLPLVVAVLIAIDPILLRQSTLIMTETLATLLTLIVWWIWVHAGIGRSVDPKRGGIRSMLFGGWIGVWIGLGVLCRPAGLVWGLGLIGASWCFAGTSLRIRSIVSLSMATGILLCVGPWMIRNQRLLGHPIAMTTHGGYTLYLANNSDLYQHLRSNGLSRRWDPTSFHTKWTQRTPVSEWEDDQNANALAWSTIRKEPDMFLWSCLARCSWLWALWPGDGSLVLKGSVGLWYLMLDATVLAAIFIGGRRTVRELRFANWIPWVPMIVLGLSLTAIHSIYWSNMRMRAPIMPAFYIAAVGFLVTLPRGRTYFKDRFASSALDRFGNS